MKGINSTLILLLTGLLSGILIAPALNLALVTALLCFGIVLLLFTLHHLIVNRNFTKNSLCSILAFLLFVFIGVIEVDLTNPLNATNHYSKQIPFNTEARLKLTVLEVLKPGFYDAKVIAKVEEINNNQASGNIIVNLLKDTTITNSKFRVDDIIYTKNQLLKIAPMRSPYQFDYSDYLKKHGIYAQVNLNSIDFLKIKPAELSLNGFAASVRDHINFKLKRFNLESDSKAVFNALLLGQRQELSEDLKADYINAGVIHILAVSGLHVGIIMLLLQVILKPLGNFRRSRIVRTGIILLAIWCFAFITGFSPSVLRAATMFTFIQIGLLLNQRQAGINALITSAFILLLIKPQLIYEVGFQLSYSAVFFIMWLYPKFNTLWEPQNKLVKYYWQLILVSIAAQLGVLPLSLFYFHQFPGVFLIANLVVLPAIGILLIYGILIILLISLNALPLFLASGFDLLLSIMNRFISALADLDLLLFKNIYFSAPLVVVSYLILIAAVIVFDKVTFKKSVLFLTTLTALPLALIATKYTQAKSEFFINHSYQKTVLTEKSTNGNLCFYVAAAEDLPVSFITNFKEKQHITEIKQDSLSYIFTNSKFILLRIDSLALFNIEGLNPDFILLTQSPKLNLNRLINRYPNVKIIADGSNYKSYVDRWESTCLKKKIPFHNTYEKGFYKIE